MKTCSKCKVDKPLDDFYNNRSKPSGKHVQCKTCHKEGKLATSGPERQKYSQQYRSSARGKALIKAANAKYKSSDKGKSQVQKWSTNYCATDAGKASSRRAKMKRKATMLSLPSEPYTVQQIIDRDGPQCWMCGVVPVGRDQTVDHLIALQTKEHDLLTWSLVNPGDVLTNVTIACRGCNTRKLNHLMLCAVLKYQTNLSGEIE